MTVYEIDTILVLCGNRGRNQAHMMLREGNYYDMSPGLNNFRMKWISETISSMFYPVNCDSRCNRQEESSTN